MLKLFHVIILVKMVMKQMLIVVEFAQNVLTVKDV